MHADWKRLQQTEPACHVAMRCLVLDPPPALPADVLSSFPSHQCPAFSEIEGLAGKGRIHTTDTGIVLFVRELSAPHPSDSQSPVRRAACLWNDEPVRIHVSLVMRPWIVQACHSTASCHLGTTRMLRCSNVFTGRLV